MASQTRSRFLLLSASAVFVAVLGTAGVRVLSHSPAPTSDQGAAAAAQAREPADLVIRNGRVVTLDERLPEVRALAARGGRIVMLGGDAEVAPFIGASTQVIDLAG